LDLLQALVGIDALEHFLEHHHDVIAHGIALRGNYAVFQRLNQTPAPQGTSEARANQPPQHTRNRPQLSPRELPPHYYTVRHTRVGMYDNFNVISYVHNNLIIIYVHNNFCLPPDNRTVGQTDL
jgi:hypothetical protein